MLNLNQAMTVIIVTMATKAGKRSVCMFIIETIWGSVSPTVWVVSNGWREKEKHTHKHSLVVQEQLESLGDNLTFYIGSFNNV